MTGKVSENKITADFVNLYLANLDMLKEGMPEFMNAARTDAIESFNIIGLPGRKSEKYKYTNISSLFEKEYEKYFAPKKIEFSVEDIFKCDVPSLDTDTLLVVNGFYFGLNKLEVLPNGVIMGSLAEAAIQYPEIVKKHYGKYADVSDEGLVALNTAFAQDGIFLYVPRSVAIEKPIQIINILISDEAILVQPRNMIILEENSQVKLVVCDHTLSPQNFLTNAATEIYAGVGSNLEYIRMQNEHNGSNHLMNIYIQQEAKSVVNTNTIALHGGIIRNNINVKFNGEGGENHIYGLSLVDKTQHVDNYSFVDHAVPNCTSNELFKNIIDDMGTAAFNGRILVRPNAQKTLAFQSNNNLLLTDDARMYTKPQLEIYADDVKCSHGATVGQMDEEALFYMRTRGIGMREARLLQMFGFAHDVIQKISIEPLRERVDELVDKRLKGELARCNTCAMHCC
ncbi:Fe-S cluster assembly protein SufD [Williamwhitmania taraxaci]|uniref:Fe-S cluster assembly protein SufD n=1 Tax=Williamwhitmania taraxaci TaxID=1640674 RepID=A0A1G6PDR9_9BACT|nr:Fe-S cluster assembly protein SufD [Williamwhitmania taraxaci]SDC77465.1 Fe-S cluster assembly protein SufD [Williamwhitmania taraxaci]